MTNFQKILKAYGREAIAHCIGVSVYSIDKYNQRGYLTQKRQMLDLGALDDNFCFNDFMIDFKES